MSDQIKIDTLRGELREEKGVVEALETSKRDAERLLSKEIGRRVGAENALRRVRGTCQEVAHEVEDPTLAVAEIDRCCAKALKKLSTPPSPETKEQGR